MSSISRHPEKNIFLLSTQSVGSRRPAPSPYISPAHMWLILLFYSATLSTDLPQVSVTLQCCVFLLTLPFFILTNYSTMVNAKLCIVCASSMPLLDAHKSSFLCLGCCHLVETNSCCACLSLHRNEHESQLHFLKSSDPLPLSRGRVAAKAPSKAWPEYDEEDNHLVYDLEDPGSLVRGEEPPLLIESPPHSTYL